MAIRAAGGSRRRRYAPTVSHCVPCCFVCLLVLLLCPVSRCCCAVSLCRLFVCLLSLIDCCVAASLCVCALPSWFFVLRSSFVLRLSSFVRCVVLGRLVNAASLPPPSPFISCLGFLLCYLSLSRLIFVAGNTSSLPSSLVVFFGDTTSSLHSSQSRLCRWASLLSLHSAHLHCVATLLLSTLCCCTFVFDSSSSVCLSSHSPHFVLQ